MRPLPFLPSMFEPPRLNRTLLINSALAAVVTIPLIFALLDVWANWNPTGHLDRIKAAVVNLDAPVSVTGADGMPRDVALGRQLTTTLTGSTSAENFDWRQTEAAAAQSGLKDGDYQVVLTIPRNFSTAATSAVRKDASGAERAVLRVRTNDAQNYLVGTIAGVVGSTATATLNAQINQTYLNNIYVGFTDLHDQIVKAADGASELTGGARRLAAGTAQASAGAGEFVVGLRQLSNGAGQLSAGTRQLAEGANRLGAGTGELSNGLDRLAAGTRALPSQSAQLNSGAQRIASGAGELPAGTRKLAAGAGDLAAGAGELAAGTQRLSAGEDELAAGTQRLSAGLDELAAGTPRLAAGAGELATKVVPLKSTLDSLSAACPMVAPGAPPTFCGGLAALAAEAPALVAGTGQVAAGAAQANTGAQRLKAGAREVNTGAQRLKAGAREVNTGAQRLAAGAGRLNAGTGQLASGAPQLAAGASRLAGGTAELAGAAPQLTNGIADAAAGARRLDTGAGRLASGTGELAAGALRLAVGAVTAEDAAGRLARGTAELAEGSKRLRAGSAQLAGGLSAGAAKIPSYTEQERKVLSAVGAAPVSTDVARVNKVAAYGAGVAPYFMAFGMWVGAMAIYLLLRPLSERALQSADPSWRIVASGLVPGVIMAALQALVMVFGLQLLVDLSAATVFGLALFGMLVGLAFTAINHAFVALLGGTGRLLSLLFAGVQLASAGGTYPVDTTPAVFRAIHELMPITHAVRGFRALIAGGGTELGTAVAALLIWTALALLVSLFAAQRQRSWTVSHLQTLPAT